MITGKICVPDPKHPKFVNIGHYHDNGAEWCKTMYNTGCNCTPPCKVIDDEDIEGHLTTTVVDGTTQGKILNQSRS